MVDFGQFIFMLVAMVVASWLVGWAIISVLDRIEIMRRQRHDPNYHP